MFRDNLIRVSACSLVLLATVAATATGPNEQNSSINGIPRLLSHVQIRNAGGKGSGTIIDKKVDADGNGWVCVLTADHVVRGQNNHLIDIGSGTVATYGGASSWFLSASPTGVVGKDIAVLGIRIGNINNDANAAARYNGIAPVALASFGAGYAGNLNTINRRIFTEHGYGRHGTFTDGGMTAGVFSTDVRRFQTNQIERWRHIQQSDGGGNPIYDYYGVEFDFNVPTDSGPLLSEGLSFVGDSGGGYCVAQLETKNIINSFRNNVHVNADGTGAVIPNVPANSQLGLWVNDLVAVHTYGNSSTTALNRFTTYNPNGTPNVHTFGGGIGMTADVLQWVNEACMVVPAPSVVSLTMFSTFFALRRRR